MRARVYEVPITYDGRGRCCGGPRYARVVLKIDRATHDAIVAHERAQNGGYEFLPRLRQELLLVVQKYVHVELDNIRVDVNRDGDCEVLEFNVTLPEIRR